MRRACAPRPPQGERAAAAAPRSRGDATRVEVREHSSRAAIERMWTIIPDAELGAGAAAAEPRRREPRRHTLALSPPTRSSASSMGREQSRGTTLVRRTKQARAASRIATQRRRRLSRTSFRAHGESRGRDAAGEIERWRC